MKSAPVLTRALVFGAALTIGVAVIGSALGFVVAGAAGVASALIGAGLTAIFMGTTAFSVLLAERATRAKPSSARYFAIIVGMWLLKFLAVIAILVAVRGEPYLDPRVMFLALFAGVIGSLVVDGFAFVGARETYT